MRERRIDKNEGSRLVGNSAVVDLKWDTAADLDLGILCEGNRSTLVFFGNEGSRVQHPYTHLAHHSDGEGRIKYRKEHAVITRLDSFSRFHIFVWDHKAATEGSKAEFLGDAESFSVFVTDKTNLRWMFNKRAETDANCVLVGVIENGKAYERWSPCMLVGTESRESKLASIAMEEVGHAQ